MQLLEDSQAGEQSTIEGSKHVVVNTPAIDGIVASSEWPEPSFSLGFRLITEDAPGQNATGRMCGRFANDDRSLFVALVTAFDGTAGIASRMEGAEFWPIIYFDGNNDGAISAGEDAKSMEWGVGETLPQYLDAHSCDWGWYDVEEQQHGDAGYTYSDDTGIYVWEFEIPLDSGDALDLAVQTGDTIGIKCNVYLGQELRRREFCPAGVLVWPASSTRFSATTYGKLVLPSKLPSSSPSERTTVSLLLPRQENLQ